MSRLSPWLTGVLLVGCLALGAWAFRQHREIVRSRLALAIYQSAQRQDKREIGELRSKLAARPAPKPEKGKTGGAAPAQGDDRETSPQMNAMLQREMRREMLRSYGGAFSSLNLSPEKLARLKTLLAEMALSGMDAFETAHAAGVEPGTPAFQRVMEQTANGVQKEIEALVGPEGWATLQHAASLSMYQSVVQNSYVPDFEDASAPLTDDQKKSLAQLLSGAANPTVRVPGYHQPDPQTWLSPADQDLLTQAGQILSPAQVSVLRGDLANQHQENAASPDGVSGVSTVISISTVQVDSSSGDEGASPGPAP